MLALVLTLVEVQFEPQVLSLVVLSLALLLLAEVVHSVAQAQLSEPLGLPHFLAFYPNKLGKR